MLATTMAFRARSLGFRANGSQTPLGGDRARLAKAQEFDRSFQFLKHAVTKRVSKLVGPFFAD